MKITRLLLLVLFILIVNLSCGPGFKIADDKIYKLKNYNDLTMVKKSKYQHETSKIRKKQQSQINKERWKKQMKNRYNK